ncbi:amidase [Rhizobium rhizophilum]|uniref:Amidase n=1 Tax=Rhizobium rhizophilum TaxID=1850373 RepID=A0ABY2QNF0_9HYPH|nr:amidase [Rhizobium rhizophilum]THV09982.1 amidase [Rhizobium rhizophilum]
MTSHAPVTPDLTALTATEALSLMADGRLTSRALVSDCLERIHDRDADVRAWLALSETALAQADLCDAAPKAERGRLHGLPIGVKDVFDTSDLPTTHNSPLFQGFQPAADAAVVDLLRSEGAIILGKTDTTEFAAAGCDAATANPHDLAHTPGGSSAGSAAAVADMHVPLALATQTGGSTIRPASFCGVVGFKPSFGRVSREGAKIYAQSFDTVGWFGRSVDDVALLASVLGLDEALESADLPGKVRIAITPGPYRERLKPESLLALDFSKQRLEARGHSVQSIDLPTEFEALDSHHRVILHREGQASFRNLARRHGSLLHDDFHHRVENRDGSSLRNLAQAYDAMALGRIAFDALMQDFDILIAPSAPGFAPLGRRPGDPVFNASWTLLGVPCLNIPVPLGHPSLPIGVTLIAARFADKHLLDVARQLEPVLNPR